MKITVKHLYLSAIVMLGAALLIFARQPVVQAQNPEVIGTWVVDSALISNRLLMIFHSDGTTVSVSQRSFAAPETPFLGLWSQEGDNLYFTSEGFVNSGDGAERIRVNGSVLFDSPDEITGEVSIDVILPTGEEIKGVDKGTYTANRMKISKRS